MKSYSGLPHNVHSDIIGKLTGYKKPLLKRKDYILVSDECKVMDFGYAGYVCPNNVRDYHSKNAISFPDLNEISFNENDIVIMDSNGVIRFVWETKSDRNGIFVTDACNCHCIMCPQPPKPHQPELTKQNYAIIKLIHPGYGGDICFTGGEPTILGNQFIDLIKRTVVSVPNASISILTNAKALSDIELARKLALLGIKKFLVCVSLHADIDTMHDQIAGSEGSFRKNQLGLYNLARFGIPTEIRIVVSKINYERLPQIAEYIFRNYSFACHITFMGLEMCGLAKVNLDRIWIDPYEYRELLGRAVHSLHQRCMKVSSYNHQLCVMNPETRSFGRKSISFWKNTYIPLCDSCSEKTECCGFFSTSGTCISKHIIPLNRSIHK